MSDIQSATTSGTERIARFAADAQLDDIPGAVRDAAKLHLLDVLGCGLAASGLGVGGAARQVALEWAGAPLATVIGSERRLPSAAAAFANGALCHALDFDDTHPASICHITVVVAPAALAETERTGAAGERTLTALVVGSEAVARIGAASAGAYMTRGFHPTSVCGVFGAAAAAAVVGGATERETTRALGLTGSMASGVFEYLADGSQTKPIHAGWAAQAGVTAVRLAAHGAEAPATILEGRFGLYAAYFDGPDALERELADLGDRWETPNIAFKPYPACHFVHSCLDAAAEIASAGVAADEVEHVVVSVPESAVELVIEPHEGKIAPKTPYDAKFSLQYSVAAMLVHGQVGLATYEPDAIRDPRVLDLAARVRYEPRAFPTYPEGLPGRVSVRTRDGRELVAELPYQRGGSRLPMAAEDVIAKFRDNAALALPDRDVAELEEGVLTLEDQNELSFLGVLGTASRGGTA